MLSNGRVTALKSKSDNANDIINGVVICIRILVMINSAHIINTLDINPAVANKAPKVPTNVDSVLEKANFTSSFETQFSSVSFISMQ